MARALISQNSKNSLCTLVKYGGRPIKIERKFGKHGNLFPNIVSFYAWSSDLRTLTRLNWDALLFQF